MPRNIEIKASVTNIDELHQLAQKLSNSEGVVINQEDVFFNVEQGRLKLRKILNGNEELIYYNRSDKAGPKLSSYTKVDRPSGELSGDLQDLLSEALGVRGKVVKKRTLYMVGQTRVHVDEVQDLGNFMELEVVLNDNQSAEEGEILAKDLMVKLKIDQENLLQNAYVDMILK